MSSKTRPWAQCAPNLVASRSPFHLAGGWGAFQRRSPAGGAAYGRPRNALTLPSLMVLPWALPCSVFTVSESAYIGIDNPRTSPARARAHVTFVPICITKLLRAIRYQDEAEGGASFRNFSNGKISCRWQVVRGRGDRRWFRGGGSGGTSSPRPILRRGGDGCCSSSFAPCRRRRHRAGR